MTDLWIHPKKLDFNGQCHNTQWSIAPATHQFTALFAKKTHEGIMGHQVFDTAESLKRKFILSEHERVVYGVLVP